MCSNTRNCKLFHQNAGSHALAVVVQKLLQLGATKDKTVRIQTKAGEDVCTLDFEDEIW